MPSIVVHGGAGTVTVTAEHYNGVTTAARTGWEILDVGGSSLDAVEAALVTMEDNPLFNAGYGSSFNLAGTIEMDASIMLSDLSFGAVGALSAASHPITAARLVMEKTDHLMVVGSGADAFARSMGLEERDLATDKRRALYEKNMARLRAGESLKYLPRLNELSEEMGLGTIGAVAIDRAGQICAATSTGGIMMGLPGRVGDSAIIGTGTYANEHGGVSATGHGEPIMKLMIAKITVDAMAEGGAVKAVDDVLDHALSHGLRFGLVGIDSAGCVGLGFTTKGMSWASIHDGSLEASPVEE